MKNFLLGCSIFALLTFCLGITFMVGRWSTSWVATGGAGKPECDYISPLVSNDLASEIYTKAAADLKVKVGEEFFKSKYRCNFIGYEYVVLPFDSMYTNYLESRSVERIVTSATLLQVTFTAEIIDTKRNLYYRTAEEPREVDVFGNGNKYQFNGTMLNYVFNPLEIDLELTPRSFPNQQAFDAITISENRALEIAANFYRQGIEPFLSVPEGQALTSISLMRWDGELGVFYWDAYALDSSGYANLYRVNAEDGTDIDKFKF